MESRSQEATFSVKKVCKCSLSVLTTVLAVVLTVYIVQIPIVNYHYLFSWHVILGTIAYIILMPESILLYSSDIKYSRLSRSKKPWIHGILFIVATILGILSIFFDTYTKIVYKNYPGQEHFISAHAITGLISVIFLVLSVITGLLTANSQWAFRQIKITPLWLKINHNILGQLGFILGMISMCLSYYTSWFVFYTDLCVRIVITLITVLITVWCLITAVRNCISYFRTVFS